MKLKKRKIKYAALFCLCWFVFLVILVDGVLKFQTLVDYFGSYALVEITLLLLVILPTLAVYRFTKEDKTMSKREYIQANKDWLEAKSKEEGVKALPKEIYYKVLACSRCISVTSGNCISLQRWVMAGSLSLASQAVQRLFLKLNC